jgi:hypothetical protein
VPLSAWVVAPTALALVTARFAPERVVQHGRRGDDG